MALGPTRPAVQWIPGPLSPVVKRPELEADFSPTSSAEIKNILRTYALMALTGTTLLLFSVYFISSPHVYFVCFLSMLVSAVRLEIRRSLYEAYTVFRSVGHRRTKFRATPVLNPLRRAVKVKSSLWRMGEGRHCSTHS